MSETRPPDEEPVESGFNSNDDFDFGEAEAEPEVKVSSKIAPINKKIVLIAFGIVFLVVIIMGYKTFRTVHLKTGESSTATSTQPITPSEIPEPQKQAQVEPIPTPAPVSPTQPASNTEQSFGEIASAFNESNSAAGTSTTNTTQKPEATTTLPPKEGSIQDLQKTLFTPPEKTKNEKITGTEQIASKEETPNSGQLNDLNNGLNKLNHQIDYILNQIKYLDSYTREVSDNLNKLNDSIGLMDSRLLALTNTTSTLSKDVGSVRSEVGHVKQVLKEDGLDINLEAISQKKAASDNRVVLDEPEYVVHAVIPGRAWLKSAKGQIVTVAEGDRIGDYGKILVIDATNGIVLTSSGIAFR